MREVFEAKPYYRYKPKCPRCQAIGSSEPVWEEQPGGMGLGSEYRMLVAPKCRSCGTVLTRTADAARPPPPEPPKSSGGRVPPIVWVIVALGVLFFLFGR